ncbi:MAG: type II secretory pathway, component PulD, partial [Opitutaceae bacterium]|nr:type II secretory pathway, component PulD [Opitutaceae bacterium]
PATPPAVAIDDNTVKELKLHNVDIDTMLETLEKLTGRIVLRPAALQTATYTLRIDRPMPKAEAILAIETVLALNQIGIAPQGDNFLKITNLQQIAKEAPQMITGSALDLPPSGRVATKLFQLEFARVQEVIPILAGVLNGFYGGPVMLQHANAAFITDSISNLQRVELLLRDIDKPNPSALKPRFFNVRNVKATDLVNKMRTMLAGPLQQTLGSATTYNADDRTQQIVVFTDPRQWDFFAELIDKLDQRSDPNTRTEVIPLNNAKATDVVNVLSKIISGQSTAIQRQGAGTVRPTTPGTPMQPPAPGQPAVVTASAASSPDSATSSEFSPFMTVVNDDRSNAVVVFGTSDDIRLVQTLVSKLDIVLAQVRIEVVIADVTLDDNHESGISTLGLKIEGNKLTGFSGRDNTVTVSSGTITRPSGDLAAEIAIGTSPRKRNNVILTQPSTVTSHGKEAKFFTGETRPVVTGTINSAAGATTGLASSSTVTQQQIGTTLTATPFIGVNGSVQLEITQSVEDVTGTVKVDANDQYIIGKRESKSYVSAKSGDILVFSGFRKATNVNETNRLGPIPILGDLLGSRKKSTARSELIFFIRATVITNNPEVDNAETMKRIDAMPARDAIKGALDSNYKPAK